MDALVTTRQPVDPILLTVARISTFQGDTQLSGASGFYYNTDSRLFLLTSRHVLRDEASDHAPDRIEIDIHVDATNVAKTQRLTIPLYNVGVALSILAGCVVVSFSCFDPPPLPTKNPKSRPPSIQQSVAPERRPPLANKPSTSRRSMCSVRP